VIGAPFIVMERQAGVRSAIPAAFQPLNNIEARVSYALIDAMAEFHALDPVAIGLGEPGKAEGFARLLNRGLCNSIFSGANHQVFNR
jgi:aminoglycoside phosphotransferase (APT) family kinase protein